MLQHQGRTGDLSEAVAAAPAAVPSPPRLPLDLPGETGESHKEAGRLDLGEVHVDVAEVERDVGGVHVDLGGEHVDLGLGGEHVDYSGRWSINMCGASTAPLRVIFANVGLGVGPPLRKPRRSSQKAHLSPAGP